MSEAAVDGIFSQSVEGKSAVVPSERKRLHNLDLLKVLAMLMVVSLHAGTWNMEAPVDSLGFYVQYAGRLLSEGVPIFVMVNGYLLFAKSRFDLKTHMKKTFKILGLLVFWSLVLVVVGSLMHGTSLAPNEIWNLFIGTRIGSLYSGPMWFMQALFALYLVFPFLRIIYNHPGKLFEYGFAIVCVFTIGLTAVDMLTSIQGVVVSESNALSELRGWLGLLSPLGNGAFLLFFMLGGMLKRYSTVFERYRARWVLGGLVAFAGSFAFCSGITVVTGSVYDPGFDYCSPFTPFILIGLYCLTLKFDGGVVYPLIKNIGSNTLGIYFVHMIVLWAVSPLFDMTSFA